MISRRPPSWASTSGEGTDDDSSSEGVVMTGLQHHQQRVKAIESSRSGNSSGNGSGWGTCSELLLVSAVKKHGVPNWNLVALELKARAIVLNISPSCFTEEKCKFRYNALKGKFASSGTGCVSSPDYDLNGVSWFEELRKLRMSHLKEELQVYDCSIGQLQLRISKLQEERALCLSPQSVMKQCDSCCEADTYSKTCKPSDRTVSFPSHCPEGPLATWQDAAGTNAAETGLPSQSIVAGDLDRHSSGMAWEEREPLLDSPGTSTLQPFGRDPVVEVERGADLTSGQTECPISHGQEFVENIDSRANVAHGASMLRENETSKEEEPDRERSSSTLDQYMMASLLETRCQAEKNVEFRSDVLALDVALSFIDPDAAEKADLEVGVQGDDSELDIAPVALCSQPGSPSTSEAVDVHDEISGQDPPEALVVTSDSLRKSSDSEVSNSTAKKVDLISKRESRLSGLGLSHWRAEKEKRKKGNEVTNLKRISWPTVRELADDQPFERTVKEDGIPGPEENDAKDTCVILERSNSGRISYCDPASMEQRKGGSIVQNFVPEFSTAVCGEGENKGEENKMLTSDSRVADANFQFYDLGVVPASSDLIPTRVFQMRSVEHDMPLLTDASGHVQPGSPVVPHRTSDISHDAQMDQEVSQQLDVKYEATCEGWVPNEPKLASSTTISPGMDGESEDLPRDTVMESETVDVYEIGMVAGPGEVETVDAEPDLSASINDDVPEALDTKGSDFGKEEGRDGPEIGEEQPFPDYPDSQIDKSEVGSSMDGIEDLSPSSRKNRREPKVPGKFLPLLECLRVICAHKFAPLFRQRQDYQDAFKYDRLIRRHLDLSMVRSRLEDGAYSGSVEFFRDLLLIFTNALVYNRSDSQEYLGAKALRSCALIEMDKILQTEALLKQCGPATRKREVRKTMEIHRVRVSSSSSGSDVRKKGILKCSSETTAASNSQGGEKSAPTAFEDIHAGRSSNNNDDSRDLHFRIGKSLKALAANRVKEETSQRELQRPEVVGEPRIRTVGIISGRKVKLEREVPKIRAPVQVLADLRASGGRLNVESVGTKMTSTNTKDVICINLERKVTPNNSSCVISSGLPMEKQQTSTSRVSRYLKRGGDGTSSTPKKRIRK